MMNRRDFLRTTAGLFPLIASTRALGINGPGPNERVRIGIIGLGGRARQLAQTTFPLPGVEIAAVCDCFKPRVDDFMNRMGAEHGCAPYLDFHEMIDKEQLDGVMVVTTTHARAWVTCEVMAAGLDVFIEKSMCLTIAEGRDMVNVARKHDRVTQVGSQQRTIPLNTWASDLVQDGAIGTVRTVLAPNFIGPRPWPDYPEEQLPEGGRADWWDVWTNQAPLRPYHSQIHTRWDQWEAYDNGGMSFGITGWGTHSYDQVQRGLGTDDTGPVEVVLEEPVEEKPAGNFTDREPGPDEAGAPFYHMVRNVHGPRARVRMKYASGVELLLRLDGDRAPGLGCIFIGDEGRIEVNRDRVSSDREDLMAADDRPEPLSVPETQPHIENWIECIKTREKCAADIEAGQRSTTICILTYIARKLGRVDEPLIWDPEAERFTNSDEGNALLSRPRREGFELPV